MTPPDELTDGSRDNELVVMLIEPDLAKTMLIALRWREDMAVVNPFGEHVWLCPCYDSEGKRIGITDCCLVSEPCEHHRFVAALPKDTGTGVRGEEET